MRARGALDLLRRHSTVNCQPFSARTGTSVLTSHRSNLNLSTSRLRFLPSRRPLSRKPNRRRRRLVSRSSRTRARRPLASPDPFHAPFASSASSIGGTISAFNCTAARAIVIRSRVSSVVVSRARVASSVASRRPPRAPRRTVVRQRVVRPRVVDDVDRAPVRARRAVLHRRRRRASRRRRRRRVVCRARFEFESSVAAFCRSVGRVGRSPRGSGRSPPGGLARDDYRASG